MKKYYLIPVVFLFCLSGCETVHDENLSTYNVHKTVTRTATYPEQDIERLLSEAHAGQVEVVQVAFPPEDLDLAGKPADYELVIDLNKNPKPPAAFLIDSIKTYETKTFKVIMSAPRDIEFDIPAEHAEAVKSLVRTTASNIVNDRITYDMVVYIYLNPTAPGTMTIPIKNNLAGKDFELTLNVADSGRSVDTFAGELGFEAFLAGGPTEEEINKEFKDPSFRSLGFKDGFRFVSYEFEDYYLLYHVLLKDGKVYDVQRVGLGP